ncbi:hypothetical protein B0H16DRAFT_1505633, partial [Mycena metata]
MSRCNALSAGTRCILVDELTSTRTVWERGGGGRPHRCAYRRHLESDNPSTATPFTHDNISPVPPPPPTRSSARPIPITRLTRSPLPIILDTGTRGICVLRRTRVRTTTHPNACIFLARPWSVMHRPAFCILCLRYIATSPLEHPAPPRCPQEAYCMPRTEVDSGTDAPPAAAALGHFPAGEFA